MIGRRHHSSQIDLSTLNYLKRGTQVQQEIFALLLAHQVWVHLAPYHPLLCGTFPPDMGRYPVEVFGQNRTRHQQEAYLYLLVEQEVLTRQPLAFRDTIIQWKKECLKTEPAFARGLGIVGDPYQSLLHWGLQQGILSEEIS